MNMNKKCKSCLRMCKCCAATNCSTCRPFGTNFVKKYNGCTITNTKFKVGDFVRVREDVRVDGYYFMTGREFDLVRFAKGMENTRGKILRITKYFDNRYRVIAEDGWSDFFWVDGMFEDGTYEGYNR